MEALELVDVKHDMSESLGGQALCQCLRGWRLLDPTVQGMDIIGGRRHGFSVKIVGPGLADKEQPRVRRQSLLHEACGGDRKSTRLNSSHLVISYAVFCLKKKNAELSDDASHLAAIRRHLSESNVKPVLLHPPQCASLPSASHARLCSGVSDDAPAPPRPP